MRIEAALPELVHIPAGLFVMGDDFGSREARPAHEINLPDYWISRYPVTALDYANYVVAEKRPLPGLWPQPVRWLEESLYPVAAGSLRGAKRYCAGLGHVTGGTRRLPAGAAMERAGARGAAATP